MKHIVEISDQDSHSFKVALYLPPKLKDATIRNSESYWHALDEGYIAVRSGRSEADEETKFYHGWRVALYHLIEQPGRQAGSSIGGVNGVLFFEYMFDLHGKVRSSGAGYLLNYGTKMKTGPIEWIVIK
jgi:hypothetical protein